MSDSRCDERAICRALTQAGYVAHGVPQRPEFRSWRWLSKLPQGRIAFFVDHPEGVERMGRERALLDLIGQRVSFAVPLVEHVSPDGRLQIRRMVAGVTSFGGRGRERALASSRAGPLFAGELGRALAELHVSVSPAEAEALGVPMRDPAPRAVKDLRERLSGRLPEQAVNAVLTAWEIDYQPEAAGVLTHGDLWAGNLAIDPDTGGLVGMFDFEDAAIADRHIDFFALHSFGDEFAEQVLDAYAKASGVRPSVRRAALHHLVAAFEALAGALAEGDPDKTACRLDWAREALAGGPGRLIGRPTAKSAPMSPA
jgi:aminoglycoside phosphotransferase (APT) family kinase protein